jgi:hypothetical protein
MHCKYHLVEEDSLEINLNSMEFLIGDNRADAISGKLLTKFYSYWVKTDEPLIKWTNYLKDPKNKFAEKKEKMIEYFQEFTTNKVFSVQF